MIGEFDARGLLMPGIHESEWAEFQERFGTNSHRRTLLDGLERAIYSLRHAGCTLIYVDGSFVTAKEHPNDYDAVWDEDGVNACRLDTVLLKLDDGRRAQKLKYYGEFFPITRVVAGMNMRFLDFFQIDKETARRKGIVSICIGGSND